MVDIALTEDEREVLSAGLIYMSYGPAYPTRALARALGFRGLEHMSRRASRIAQRIDGGLPLAAVDWERACRTTDLAINSWLLGVGSEFDAGYEGWVDDWQLTSGYNREQARAALLSALEKLPTDVFYRRAWPTRTQTARGFVRYLFSRERIEDRRRAKAWDARSSAGK